MSDQDELECPVCLNTYELPRILPCGHTFCNKCVDQLTKVNTIQCPEDRNTFQVPQDGISGFPVNYIVSRLLEKRCKQCRRNQPDTNCSHCNIYLCESCVKSHTNHQVATDAVWALQQKILSIENILQTVVMRHQGLVEDIETSASNLHQAVTDRTQQLKTELMTQVEPENCWLEKTREMLATTRDSYDNLAKDIRDEYDMHIINDVISACHRATEKLDVAMENRVQVSDVEFDDSAESVKQAIQCYGDIKHSTNDEPETHSAEARSTNCHLLDHQKNLRKTLWQQPFGRTYCVKHVFIVLLAILMPMCGLLLYSTGTMDIDSTPIVIGKRGSGPLQFHNPFDVSQCPVTHHILIVDFANNRIQVLDEQFNHKFDINRDGNGRALTNPWRVHATVDGNIVIWTHNTGRMLMYNSEGVYLRDLSYQKHKYGGITSDMSKIYTCELNGISIYDLQGEYIESRDISSHCDDGPQTVLVHGEYILITCGSSIHYFSKSWTLICTIDTKAEDIYGLAVDKDHTIFYKERGHGITVHRGHQVVQTIGEYGSQPHQLGYYTRKLIVTADNKLLVANIEHNNLLYWKLTYM